MTEDPSKWKLTVDFIMIIAKYFKENKDFINVMRVCKMYKELVSMYKFNPISDTSLFKKIQTQHFYKEEDVRNKKANMFQYIYWIAVNSEEIIKHINERKDERKENRYKKCIINIKDEPDVVNAIKDEYENINIGVDFEEERTTFDKLIQFDGYELLNLPNWKCYERKIGVNKSKYKGIKLSFKIPEGTQSIGQECFSGIQQLTNIELPRSLKNIGRRSFENTRITRITVPEGVTNMGDRCFDGCSRLTNITLPSSLTNIDDNSFSGTHVRSITIPEGITRIANHSFYNCSQLTNIDLPSSLKEIGDFTFSNTKITRIIIPEGVTRTGPGCFADCSTLTNITLPSSLKEISDRSFRNSNITSIIIPEGVTNIGWGSFANCTRLTNIILPSTLRQITMFAFNKTGIETITIPYGVNVIGNCCFSECIRLKTVQMSDSVKVIGAGCFYNCNQLEVFRFPKLIQFVGVKTFDGCTKLRLVIIRRDYYQLLNKSFVGIKESVKFTDYDDKPLN